MSKRSYRRKNKILEGHGDWLLLDISTSKFPSATMAVDTDVFEAHEGGRICAFNPCSRQKYIYGYYNMSGKHRFLHRDVIDAGDMQVDHIKHGTMSFVDNRRSNLRAVTRSQNGMNGGIQINNTSGVVGVSWHKRYEKWQSHIRINGKRKNLGSYDNIDFAIGARQQAEKVYFGEYAYKGE